MSSIKDLQDGIAGLSTKVTAAAATATQLINDVNADVNAKLQSLQQQIANGTPVTQQQLDDVVTSLTPISTALDQLGTSLQTEDQTVAPAPPPAPGQ